MYLGFYRWWALYYTLLNVAILACSSQTGIDVILVMCLRECAGLRGCNSSVCLNPCTFPLQVLTRISWGSSLQRLTEYKRWTAKLHSEYTLCSVLAHLYPQPCCNSPVLHSQTSLVPRLFLVLRIIRGNGPGYEANSQVSINFNAGSHIWQPGMKLMLDTNQAFMTEGIERTCLCEGNLMLSVIRLIFIERVAYIL